MNSRLNMYRTIGVALLLTILTLFLLPDIAEARRGGGGRSFGGSRGRSFSRPSRSSSPSTKQRSTTSRRSSTPKTASGRAASSFGGTRLNSSKAYTQKYGTPRQTTTRTVTGANGRPTNYVMYGYGGYGSSLMTGYMLGATSWMWSMPFHPAFYYSRPYYVDNPDGTVGVYPPTFSWSKLFFSLLIAAVIIYIIYAIFRKRKVLSDTTHSSFG